MPEFLDSYAEELRSKSERIREDFVEKITFVELEETFKKNWESRNFPEGIPSAFSVFAVDSSSQHVVTSNGGVFYIARSLGISRDKKYRRIVADFDFTSNSTHEVTHLLGRKMEWLEHEVALQAVRGGFRGYVIFDGSIYGRLAHIPLETGFVRDRAFMLSYFDTVTELLEVCKRERVPLVGISKESRTSFFREFLIKTIAVESEIEVSKEEVERILSLALDNKRLAIRELERLEREKGEKKVEFLKLLVEELLARRPDFQLILSLANTVGHTKPLLLGAPIRWRRAYDQISHDPEEFVRSNFPVSSRSREFVDWAVGIVEKIPELPAVVSFHILPALNDTPMRVDVPAWVFGIKKKLSEVGWPEAVNVELGEILGLIFAGYCGVENYNVWLSAVDEEVRLSRDAFENLYLPKFEEIVGRFATPRGYRRVRFP